MMQLDPLPWSQKLPFATLGNINFSSTFLGLANIVYFKSLIEKKTKIEKRFFDFALILVNGCIIVYSNSIQGLAVFLAGICATTFSKLFARSNSRSKGWVKQWPLEIMYGFFILAIGLLLLCGSAGVGPLGALLVQETVKYRLDYWLAGLSMFRANYMTGIGIDSYGDFYREFRNLEAATSGASRVANTAHNVFIDLFAGGGVFLGIAFVILIAIGVRESLKILKSEKFESPYVTLSSMFFGWLVFLAISINQIGVTVWGFLVLGTISGFSRFMSNGDLLEQIESQGNKFITRQKSSKSAPRIQAVENSNRLDKGRYSLILGMFIGILLALPPNYGDAKVSKLMKSSNLKDLSDLRENYWLLPTHLEFVLYRLVENELDSESLVIAEELIEWNPRSFYPWAVIAFNKTATDEMRRNAQAQMIKLDPKNQDLKNQLNSIG
jgi:hypothetical protein